MSRRPAKKRRGTAPPKRATTRRRGLWIGIGILLALAGAGLIGQRLRPRRRPNLLLITIDTLRADHLGAYGNPAAATPYLDTLARSGLRFEQVQASVPLTGPSHATILTGLLPPTHGVRDNVTFVLDRRHKTLATSLKAQGYETAAFVAAFTVASGFGFGNGFDHFDERLHAGGAAAERPANEVADATINWLAAPHAQPFFAWVHFYDPHEPYTPPSPFRERFPDRPYDGEIAFADEQVGRVLAALQASEHGAGTVVAVLSDHGEGLGDHQEQTHGVLAYQSTLRVPWILSGPGVPKGLTVAERVGTEDVLPTLLRLLRIDPPADLPGRDLTPAFGGTRLAPEALYAESLFGRLNCRWSALRSLTVGDWKLVAGAAPELYNLALDPGETQDLASRETERVRQMQDALQAALRRMAPEGDRAQSQALTAEEEERLRSLGYASGGSGSGALDQKGLPDPRARINEYDRLQLLSAARGPAMVGAVNEMVRIVEGDPGNPYAAFALGRVAQRIGQLELARRSYARTIELDPDRPAMRQQYARLLHEVGAFAEAEQQFRIALQQSPSDDRARMGLATALIAMDRGDEAAALIDAVLKRSPNDTEAHAASIRLALGGGRIDEAVTHLPKAGNDPEPWVEVSRAWLAAGNAPRAREIADGALAINRAHPWALAIAGHADILMGRRAEGLELLKRALAIGPRRPEAWADLARAFEAAGETAAAETCRRRGRSPASGQPEASQKPRAGRNHSG